MLVDLLRVREQLDAYRSVLVEVVALAGMAPGLSDERLRTVLVVLGERAGCLLGGEIR
ncbi:MAG: hypothetical protein JO063_12575 [Pseudonocardiales bacterium]|nr:hypothetical protein [Pseudonocardiales bacterium]MBV9030364.1 hypothetical protein [Pseudonocardiales bacterium]MBW0010925.1 hypothetical protein [Pseudonocardiales bacterium]